MLGQLSHRHLIRMGNIPNPGVTVPSYWVTRIYGGIQNYFISIPTHLPIYIAAWLWLVNDKTYPISILPQDVPNCNEDILKLKESTYTYKVTRLMQHYMLA